MAGIPFDIPQRTSSRVPLHERSLAIKASKHDLKSKLSTISYGDSPSDYTRLKIEELETEIEEQKLHKDWLDVEKKERNLTDTNYRKDHRETNKRIISLGNDLWTQKQQLRALSEKAGKAPYLGPDSEGAFVHTLLALYKDPYTSSARLSNVQTQMRNASIEAYQPGQGAPEGLEEKFWCPIAKGWFDAESVRAAHIVPRAIRPEVVDYLFGVGSSSRLNTSDNCLLIHESVERAFDKGVFVLLPIDPKEQPIKRWKIQLINDSALNTDMGRTNLRSLNDSEVEFHTEARPASRFLHYHFVVSILRNKLYRQPGWETYLTELPTGRPFATSGKYLRESMLLTLGRHAGDLTKEEEARLLVDGGETFAESSKLEQSEENEIARQILEAHDE
ncbi:MAG: hypothetical protein Q9191_001279 [Dirinaria sp. TL-2023a]